MYIVPSVNIRQLRDTAPSQNLAARRRNVELRERARVIARIVPERVEKSTVQYPDFAARRKKIFGDRILPGADLLIKERGRY